MCPDEGTETRARQPGEKNGDDDSLVQVLFSSCVCVLGLGNLEPGFQKRHQLTVFCVAVSYTVAAA